MAGPLLSHLLASRPLETINQIKRPISVSSSLVLTTRRVSVFFPLLFLFFPSSLIFHAPSGCFSGDTQLNATRETRIKDLVWAFAEHPFNGNKCLRVPFLWKVIGRARAAKIDASNPLTHSDSLYIDNVSGLRDLFLLRNNQC